MAEIGPILQMSATLAMAGLGLAIGIQKLLKNWKETSTENSVLSIMHQEMERMSGYNTTLSKEVNRLNKEVLRLNSELVKLTLENHRLRSEVTALNLEILSVKKTLDK